MTDAPPAAPAGETPPAGKKSRLLLIIIVAVVVLALGGGAAYFFLGRGESATKDGEAHAAEGKESEPKAPAVYVSFDPPFVVNFEAKGLMRFLQVSVQVMTRDPHIAELIKQHDPMIRNDLLMMFSSQTYETINSREGKEKMRTEALKVVAEVIGREGGDAAKVEQLYFTSFVMQ